MGENRADRDDVVIGVVSDTHIPDRVVELHPNLIPGLQAAGVNLIFHAGDISTQWTLDQLNKVAPVTAVRGNRDIFTPSNLPFEREMIFNGVRVFLAHGHGSLMHYLWDKGVYMLSGYKFTRYQQYMASIARHAPVVVFGHTHRAEIRQVGESLFFNPGSAGPNYDASQPSYGILRIDRDGGVEGKINYLENYPVRNRRWMNE